MDELELLSQLGLLSPEQRQQTERDARVQGLLSLGSALMQAGQGGGGRRVSTLQGLGMAAPAYMQGQQRAFDETLQGILKRTQLQDLLAKRQEQEAAKRRQQQVQQMIPGLYRERIGQVPTTIPTETYEDVRTTTPGVVGMEIDPVALRALSVLGPEGRAAALQAMQFEKAMQPERVILKADEVAYDPMTGQELFRAPSKPKETYRQLTAEEAKQFGLPSNQVYQISSGGKISSVSSGPLVQNIFDPNKREQTLFEKIDVPLIEGLQSSASSARDFANTSRTINQLLKGKGGGALVKIGTELAKNLNIKNESVTAQDLAQSMVVQLAPRMRPVGSGSTSDLEFKSYMSAVPSLANGEKGREIMTVYAEKFAQRSAKLADYARKLAKEGKLTNEALAEYDNSLGAILDDKFYSVLNTSAPAATSNSGVVDFRRGGR